MSRRNHLPTVKRHIVLFDEDWAWLDAHFGRNSATGGAGNAVRLIVHDRVKALRAREISALDEIPKGQGERDEEIVREFLSNNGEEK